jgi:hypothetical protein
MDIGVQRRNSRLSLWFGFDFSFVQLGDRWSLAATGELKVMSIPLTYVTKVADISSPRVCGQRGQGTNNNKKKSTSLDSKRSHAKWENYV